MRVELIYTPGCHTYKKILDKLETVIAEERLPIPVNVIETTSHSEGCLSNPTIRIDGHDIHELEVSPQGEACRLYHGNHGVSGVPCIESLRDILFRKWKELTEAPLLGS